MKNSKKIDKYVSGPEEGHIAISDKSYLVDYITTTPVKVGDFVKDQWCYARVVKIVDRAENGYTLFEGYELKKEEYRERMIKKIIE